MAGFVYNGSWRTLKSIYVYNGAWRSVKSGWVYNGGWRRFFTVATPGTPTISTSSNASRVTWTVSFGANTTSVKIEYGTSLSYGTTVSQGTDGGSTNSASYTLSSSNSPLYWRITPYNSETDDYGTAVTGSKKFTMPAVTLGTPVRTSTGYTVSITNYNQDYTLNVSVNNSSTFSYGSPSGTNLPIFVSIPNANSTTLTAYYSFTDYTDGASDTVSSSKLPPHVSPGRPTNPVNTYNGVTGSTYRYSASWTAPTTGTTPFEYFLQVFGASSAVNGTTGSGGSFVGQFGPFSSTNGSYTSLQPWNYFQVYARNSDGNSYYLSQNSVSSLWR
jgi:hypothetical protein